MTRWRCWCRPPTTAAWSWKPGSTPYRLQAGGVPALCAASPAVQHPGWVRATAEGLYLNPASAEVRQYIADGVAELCENYALDGIHFDDYFYPTTDPRL